VVKRRKAQPAIQKTIEWLHRQIRQMRASSQNAFPPVRFMAQQAGVSLVTMQKALKMLQQQQLVAIYPGRGVFLSLPPKPADEHFDEQSDLAASVEHGVESVPQHLAKMITDDIRTGRFYPGNELPVLLQLQAMYGGSVRSIRTALKMLRDRHLLQLRGKTYHVHHAKAAKKGAFIIVICAFSNPQRNMFYSPRSEDIWKYLEKRSLQRGLHLAICPFLQSDNQKQHPHFARKIAELVSGQCMGFFVWTAGMHSGMLNRIIELTRPHGLPVALLEEFGVTDIPTFAKRYASDRFIHFFWRAISARSGAHMAQWVSERGHRHVAYFSKTLQRIDANNRCRGFKQALQHYGAERGHLYAYAVSGSLESKGRLASLKQSNEERFLNTSTKQQYSELLQSAFEKVKHFAAEEDIARLEWAGEVIVRSMHDQASFEPLLTKALQHKQISCWVVENDRLAIIAKQFLHQQGMEEKIVLYSFDNTLDAVYHGISSYDFNSEAYVEAIIDFCLHSPGRQWKKKENITELQGSVIERSSSARNVV